MCRWSEPDLRYVSGAPECEVSRPGPDDPAPHPSSPRPLFNGVLTRVSSCELEYGPLSNCDFQWRGVNSPVLDEDTLPPVGGKGRVPCPSWDTPAPSVASRDRMATPFLCSCLPVFWRPPLPGAGSLVVRLQGRGGAQPMVAGGARAAL